MTVAIIDIGSNSVRMLVEKDGKTVKKFINTTRLAQGKKDGFLCEKSSLRTLNGVKEFVLSAKDMGADKIFAFATAAVRNSVNGEEFVRAVKEDCGIAIEVLSGEREGYIGAMGALKGEDGGVIDIGGGSTEIAVIRGKELVYSRSIPFGAVNVTEKFGEDFKRAKEFLNTEVKKFGDVPKCEFKVIGGTATSLAAIILKLTEYSAEKVDGLYMSEREINALTEELYSKTAEERKNYKSLQKERADIIQSGANILRAVTGYLGINGVTVSESDNLEGYSRYSAEKI